NRGGARASAPGATPETRLVRTPRGLSVGQEIARLRHQRGVVYAVPDYLAHIGAAGQPGWVPDDPGRTRAVQGWQHTQWNFLAASGVNAPQAWANLFAEKHPGGRGAVVAVLDTGVAYRRWHQFRRSPDFARTRFADP